MPINNSMLHILFAKGQEQGHTILVFFTPILKHLHNMTQTGNVLHINGKGYAKENKDLYRFGLQDWLLQ